jgi:hypothetical protein
MQRPIRGRARISVTSSGGASVTGHAHAFSLLGLVPNLALACNQRLAGLITDIERRCLLDQTLVAWGDEMGGRGGDGHMYHNGSEFTWWMAGGGVNAGTACKVANELFA